MVMTLSSGDLMRMDKLFAPQHPDDPTSVPSLLLEARLLFYHNTLAFSRYMVPECGCRFRYFLYPKRSSFPLLRDDQHHRALTRPRYAASVRRRPFCDIQFCPRRSLSADLYLIRICRPGRCGGSFTTAY